MADIVKDVELQAREVLDEAARRIDEAFAEARARLEGAVGEASDGLGGAAREMGLAKPTPPPGEVPRGQATGLPRRRWRD